MRAFCLISHNKRVRFRKSLRFVKDEEKKVAFSFQKISKIRLFWGNKEHLLPLPTQNYKT